MKSLQTKPRIRAAIQEWEDAQEVKGGFGKSEPCLVFLMFLSCRWFFEVLGYPKSSKANIINGVLMTVVFFMVRIAVIPFYYGRVISAFGTEAFQRLGLAAQSAWIISSVVLDVMNLMWMFKITKGCYKVICLIGQEEAKTRKNGKSE